MTYIWMAFCLLLCGIAELLFGTGGVYVPLLLMSVFYFTAFKHWRFALLTGLFVGSAIEMGYGRPVPTCLILMPVIMVLSKFWRWMGGTAGILRQSIPGMFVGMIGGIAASFWQGRIMGTHDGCVRMTVIASVFGFCLFPVMCGVFDMVAGWMALNRYTRLSSGRGDDVFWQEEYDFDEDFID